MSKEKYKLEDKIREIIYDDNKNSAHFEYEISYKDYTDIKSSVTVQLITLNRKTNTTFLLTQATGPDEVTALARILDYLEEKSIHTFTIKWYVFGEKAERPYKSKFTAHSITSAIEKFYYKQNIDTLVIYSISDDNIKSKDYEGQ